MNTSNIKNQDKSRENKSPIHSGIFNKKTLVILKILTLLSLLPFLLYIFHGKLFKLGKLLL